VESGHLEEPSGDGRLRKLTVRDGTPYSLARDALLKDNHTDIWLGAPEMPYNCGYVAVNISVQDVKLMISVAARQKTSKIFGLLSNRFKGSYPTSDMDA
jgi:hypothetical protein